MAPRKDADYEITIVRAIHDGENPFFLTRRATAQNRDLSYAARGLLWYLLSRPDDWTVMISDLEQQCGRDKVYSLLTELQDAGHLERNQARAEGGKFGKRGYTVHELPLRRDATATQETNERPLTDLPEAVTPDTVTPVTDLPLTAAPHPVDPLLQNKESVLIRESTEEKTTPSSDGVPRDAGAHAATEPSPKVIELSQSVALLVDAPTLPVQSEEPPSVPAVPPAGDVFYVTADGANYGPYTSYNAVKADVSAHGFKQVAVTQVRPDGELIAPAKSGRKPRAPKADKPPLEQPPTEIKDRMAALCFGGNNLLSLDWMNLVKAWNGLGKPGLDQLDKFDRYWHACDWRGLKGQAPTLAQLRSEWSRAQNWDGATPVAVTPYQQNYRSKAELDAERNRINVQKGIEKARQFQAEREANGNAPKDVSNLLAWKAELEAKRGKS